ncbi:MAG: GNAT family N-acetyltransferase [Bacteroidota bacterium]
MCELWPESKIEEELAYVQSIQQSEKDCFFRLIDDDILQGFIQLKIRSEYAEGANSSPLAYVEGIYIRTAFRRKAWADKLIKKPKHGLAKRALPNWLQMQKFKIQGV